jgi:phosphomannomutase
MTRLRARPPQSIIGSPVTVTDMLQGSEQLPPTDGVRIIGGAFTVAVRPSGTEPKLKCYLEARLPPEVSTDLPAARAVAHRMLQNLRSEISSELGLSSDS